MSWLLEGLAWFSMVAGSFVLLVTGLGILTLPDYYSRIHAASITDTLGAGLVLFGLVVQATSPLVAAKLVLVLVFLVLTGPAASHALAKTAQLHDIPLPARRDEESSS